MKTEYICSTCGQVVAGEIELKQHRTAHANERSDSAASPATWDSDSNLTTNSNRLGSPLIPNGNGQTACGNCPKVFRDVNELLQVVTIVKLFIIIVCSRFLISAHAVLLRISIAYLPYLWSE